MISFPITAMVLITGAAVCGDGTILGVTDIMPAGFESFEETETGMEAYVQKDLFDKEALDAYISDFPIMDTQITYDIQDAEDKDWNQEWEEQGFAPIFVDDQVVIYDAKHPELYPDTSNRPDIIEIGIEAKLAFGTGNHETTRMIISQLLQMPIKTKQHSVGICQRC